MLWTISTNFLHVLVYSFDCELLVRMLQCSEISHYLAFKMESNCLDKDEGNLTSTQNEFRLQEALCILYIHVLSGEVVEGYDSDL